MSEQTYKVWDKLNSDEEYAEDITAWSPEAAAEEYADNDADGLCDGLYLNSPHPIMVRHEDGTLEEYSVYGEATVDYHASKVKP